MVEIKEPSDGEMHQALAKAQKEGTIQWTHPAAPLEEPARPLAVKDLTPWTPPPGWPGGSDHDNPRELTAEQLAVSHGAAAPELSEAIKREADRLQAIQNTVAPDAPRVVKRAMEIRCRQCSKVFTPRSLEVFCSPECAGAYAPPPPPPEYKGPPCTVCQDPTFLVEQDGENDKPLCATHGGDGVLYAEAADLARLRTKVKKLVVALMRGAIPGGVSEPLQDVIKLLP